MEEFFFGITLERAKPLADPRLILEGNQSRYREQKTISAMICAAGW
jgi:hypothetical protein